MLKKTQARLEKVSNFLIQGLSEKEIANKLDVSRQTIVRDVAFLKKTAPHWIDDLAKGGFVFEYKLSIDKLNDIDSKLSALFDQSKDIWEKIAIAKTRKEIITDRLEMLGETPTIHAFRKAMQLRNVQAA